MTGLLCPRAATAQLRTQVVATGLTNPVAFVGDPADPSTFYVVEQRGTIRTVRNNTVAATFALDLRSQIAAGGERGLLGLAFHPSFESNRKFYAYYTDGSGDLLIGEFTATADGSTWNGANPAILLDIEHSSQSNHNGGQLLFGPDGHLYIFTGDGGGGGDPFCNAQSTGSLLGKVLRISVPGNGTFGIPAGNYSGAIWDLGLRNPWRASFDRLTGDLWIGDVGQGNFEEIDLKLAGAGTKNYGWSQREGAHPFSDGTPCASSDIASTDPIAEYSQGSPKAVTGGFVYRGSLETALIGHYVFADFYSGNLWTLANGVATFHGSTGAMISSFGESESGELYAVDLPAGQLYRVVAPTFTDIAGSQFFDDIMWLVAAGITTGCGGGQFCPGHDVSREQMASFLFRAKGFPATGTDFFTDDEGSIHEDDINRSAAAGITTGCGGGQFCPGGSVTREQMASFLVRAKGYPSTDTDFFTDDEGSPHEDDINRLAAAGITTGCTGGRYCPLDAVSREQMAAFLRRAFG